MAAVNTRTLMEALDELRTTNLLSFITSLLSSVLPVTATTLFKLAIISMAKVAFVAAKQHLTGHQRAVIHVQVLQSSRLKFTRNIII